MRLSMITRISKAKLCDLAKLKDFVDISDRSLGDLAVIRKSNSVIVSQYSYKW